MILYKHNQIGDAKMSIRWSTKNKKLVELSRKLGLKHNQVISFDLPAGYTCPAASLCQSFAHRETGRIRDGKDAEFRCYAASVESAFTNSRKAHWSNFEAIKGKTSKEIARIISESLPKNTKIVRIHSSGDFFNKTYFNAWIMVAKQNPEIIFYGYTKILDYVKAEKPSNFKLVYSYGGKHDSLRTDEPTCFVVKSESDAKRLGLHVACPKDDPANDYEYIMQGVSFAIILHGTQPAKKRS